MLFMVLKCRNSFNHHNCYKNEIYVSIKEKLKSNTLNIAPKIL